MAAAHDRERVVRGELVLDQLSEQRGAAEAGELVGAGA
jgi:hypothetical protein